MKTATTGSSAVWTMSSTSAATVSAPQVGWTGHMGTGCMLGLMTGGKVWMQAVQGVSDHRIGTAGKRDWSCMEAAIWGGDVFLR